MKIVILIPVYNEARAIGTLVEHLKKQSLDVMVINDGSSDRSREIAQEKGAVVLSNEQRTGKGASLQKGFEYILKQDYDAVVTMDGDGQHAVEDLEEFFKVARMNPSSIVTGNRMSNCKTMPKTRYFTNRFMSFLISSVCRQRIPDTQCGYRYISRDVLKQLSLRCNDFEIETEILIQASKKGFRVYSVPIKTIYSDEESYIRPVRDTIRFMIYFFKELFNGK